MYDIPIAPSTPRELRWEHFHQFVYSIPQTVWTPYGSHTITAAYSNYGTEGYCEALVQMLDFFYNVPLMPTKEMVRAFASTTYLGGLSDHSLDLLYARAFNYIDETSIWPKYEVFPYLQHLTEAGVLPDWKWRYYAKYNDVVATAGRYDLLKKEDHISRWVIDEDFRRSIKRIYLTFPDSILHFVLRAMGRLNGASMTKREYLELARSCGNCRNTALKYLDDIIYRMQITFDYTSKIINPENKVFILK
jgi:hypothetical protein